MNRGLVLPAAAIATALAALLILAQSPDLAAPRHAAPDGPVALPTAPRPERAGVAQPRLAPAGAPAVSPLEPSPRPVVLAAAPVNPEQTNPRLAGYKVEITWDAEVARATDLFERLKIVDKALGTADPEDSVAFVERLLDRTPGATPEDVRALRMGLFSRLGLVKGAPRAAARLVQGLDVKLTRPERLAAIDALGRDGAIPETALAPLGKIADSDADLEVRRRARTVLGRPAD